MQRYIFKIFYLGNYFTGSQRQANGMSIFNLVELAFVKSKHISSFRDSNFIAMSRTDMGVSALASYFTLDLNKKPMINWVNKYLPKDNSIIIYNFAKISQDFNPRYPEYKIYKYALFDVDMDIMSNLNRLHGFFGIHDFSNLMRKDGAGERNPITEILEISIEQLGNAVILTFRGDKFGREQIRKMVGYITDKSLLKVSPSHILKDTTINVCSAPAKFLFLVDAKFSIQNINWVHDTKNLLQFEKLLQRMYQETNLVYFQSTMINQLISDLTK